VLGEDRSRELQLPTWRHVGRVKFVRWVDDAHPLVKAVSHGDESCRWLRNLWDTVFVEIPYRGHALTIDNGWRDVADTALTFIGRHT
jgi:hypothetical protein